MSRCGKAGELGTAPSVYCAEGAAEPSRKNSVNNSRRRRLGARGREQGGICVLAGAWQTKERSGNEEKRQGILPKRKKGLLKAAERGKKLHTGEP